MKMEREKNTAAAESDHGHNNQAEKANDGSGAARSYDCAFCKRGFTNAQALGGHMNIHRKDKAKAKAKAKAKHKIITHEDPLSCSSFFHPRIAAADYHQVHNPGLQTGNYEYCFFPVWRPHTLQDRIDGSLNLTIEAAGEDEEEVDLELRLGRLF